MALKKIRTFWYNNKTRHLLFRLYSDFHKYTNISDNTSFVSNEVFAGFSLLS